MFWRRKSAVTEEERAREALASARNQTEALRHYRPLQASAEENLRNVQPPGFYGP